MKFKVIEGGRSKAKLTKPPKKMMKNPSIPVMHNLQEVMAYAIAFGYSLGKSSHSHSPMTPENVEKANYEAKQGWREFLQWAEEFENDYQDAYEEWLAIHGEA